MWVEKRWHTCLWHLEQHMRDRRALEPTSFLFVACTVPYSRAKSDRLAQMSKGWPLAASEELMSCKTRIWATYRAESIVLHGCCCCRRRGNKEVKPNRQRRRQRRRSSAHDHTPTRELLSCLQTTVRRRQQQQRSNYARFRVCRAIHRKQKRFLFYQHEAGILSPSMAATSGT